MLEKPHRTGYRPLHYLALAFLLLYIPEKGIGGIRV